MRGLDSRKELKMLESTKWVCYYRPHKWRTLDEWNLHIVELPLMQMATNISYGNSKFILEPSLDIHHNHITLIIRPEDYKDNFTFSDGPPAGALRMELWEPAGGWRKAISWSTGMNGKASKT